MITIAKAIAVLTIASGVTAIGRDGRRPCREMPCPGRQKIEKQLIHLGSPGLLYLIMFMECVTMCYFLGVDEPCLILTPGTWGSGSNYVALVCILPPKMS